MTLSIRNPHSVLAALERRPEDVLEIVLPPSGAMTDAWSRVAKVARDRKVRVSTATLGKPQREKTTEGGRFSAAEARVKECEGISPQELFADASARGGGHGLWLALDSIQDPHNVGAIFRAAAFFGVQGILLTQERSAPLSSTVYDVASGGLEVVPFSVQVNLQQAFRVAKESGLWILGTSEHARDSIDTIQKDRPWLLVLGNEEKGMRRLTEESCDVLCGIHPKGEVKSLNVSVAAGILISKLA